MTKLFVFATLTQVSLSTATMVFRDPAWPLLGYPVTGELGQGFFGKVFSVQLPSGAIGAMKEEYIDLDAADTETEALAALRRYPRTGPTLFRSFVIPTTTTKGRRMTLMSLVGKNLKQYLNNGLTHVPEYTTASIGLQITHATMSLHRAGYFHNDIHWENVAFVDPSSIDEVVLVDFGCASKLSDRVSTLSHECISEFAVENVIRKYLPACPLDISAAMETDEFDKSIIDYANSPGLSAPSRIALLNARIVGQILLGRRSAINVNDSVAAIFSDIVSKVSPRTDRDWFLWAMLDAKTNYAISMYLQQQPALRPYSGLIRATRDLVRFLQSDSLMRKELFRIAKTYLELMGIRSFGTKKISFMELVTRETIDTSLFAFIPIASQKAIMLVWEVMRGREPKLQDLDDIFVNVIKSHNMIYTGHILW